MLLSISVKNYALIDELSVEFHEGLNIITGETGAGKSILLGALGLILGKRADLTVLLDNENKCIVEADFNIRDYKLQAVFKEKDVDYEEHTVFRREILASGKSRAFINDTPVNLSVMQDLALHLVDIHSQHQNLQLNKQVFLLGLIDKYCGNDNLLEEYSVLYNNFRKVEREYIESKQKYEAIKEQFEFVSHQHNELKEANLQPDEYNNLKQELAELENSSEIKLALHEVESILSNEESGIIDTLNSAVQKLNKISSFYKKAEVYSSQIGSALIDLKDVNTELSNSFEQLEFDPNHLEHVRERMNLLNSLLLKYKKQDIAELIELQSELEKKLAVAIDGGFDLEKQKEALNFLQNELQAKADNLSNKRQEAFEAFEDEILKYLTELGMGHAVLSFSRNPQELSPTGIDIVNFHFSANKNHPMQEVSKIASGGELSRLMLAIKSVLSTSVAMPTLILDEIDTGVSGEIADKVGSIIKGISSGIQVINITHLPQVASKGNSHFLVYKDHNGESSRTLIRKLSDDERLKEIAKMLSGEELTDAAMENAKVLLGK